MGSPTLDPSLELQIQPWRHQASNLPQIKDLVAALGVALARAGCPFPFKNHA